MLLKQWSNFLRLQKIMLGLFPTFCNKNYVISCLRNWTPQGLNSPFLPIKTLIDFAVPGFLFESIQSVISVPSCLQNLQKLHYPFPKFWIMNGSVSLKVPLKSVSSIKKWAKSGFLDEWSLITPGILRRQKIVVNVLPRCHPFTCLHYPATTHNTPSTQCQPGSKEPPFNYWDIFVHLCEIEQRIAQLIF